MNKKSKLKIHYLPLFVTIIYPFILLILACVYSSYRPIGKFEIMSVIVSYYIFNISVGVGLHRLWSHNTFKTKKWVEFILACLTAGTLQGPILAWASDHMIHHRHTDKELDPHSALKYKNKFLGFIWSHIGWMILSDQKLKKIDKIALIKLGRNKIVLWQFKNYWKIAIFMNTVLPFLLGYFVGGTLYHAISCFIFIGIGRVLQQQATFCVNSVVHTNIGSRKYYSGTAADVWWLFFLLLGENWHNFHHAFANDYRNGHKWYHLDIHKWIIALMFRLKIADELVVTSSVRIESIQKQIAQRNTLLLKKKVDLVEKASKSIHTTALDKLGATEKSAINFANNLNYNLNSLIEKARLIINFAQDLKLKSNLENCEERLISTLLNKYSKLEKAAQKLKIKVTPL